jgi:polar amino acid transport system substrate-binding protein
MKRTSLLLGLVACLALSGPTIGAGARAQEATPAFTPTADCDPIGTPVAVGDGPAIGSPPLLREGRLVMSINATLPPIQYVDENGELKGMRVELGEEIARRLGLEAEWVNIQFDAMIPGLEGDRWDMINTGLYFTEERAEIMELIPFQLNAISISVPAGNPDGVEATADLAGRTVAVEIGGYEERNIREINDEQVAAGLEPMEIRTFNTFADSYQALAAGQVDAVVSSDAGAKFYEDRGSFARAISGLRGSPATLAFKSRELAEVVAAVLNEMKADGSYRELLDRYGVTPLDADCFAVY